MDVLYVSNNWGEVFKSIDKGTTWINKSGDLEPVNGLRRRTELAVAPNNANIVYAIIEDEGVLHGVFKSTDSGDSFFEVYTMNKRHVSYS